MLAADAQRLVKNFFTAYIDTNNHVISTHEQGDEWVVMVEVAEQAGNWRQRILKGIIATYEARIKRTEGNLLVIVCKRVGQRACTATVLEDKN